MASAILQLNEVSAGYDGVTVIRDVNLTIKENDFLGIIGANGCGKTTLLKVMLGLIKPIKGTVTYGFDDNVQSAIGYLPQFHLIDKSFPIRVKDVIDSGISSKLRKRLGNNKIKTLREEIVGKLKISELENKVIGELSGGQTQKVFLARALISKPKLLILDEPDTFIDKESKSSMYTMLAEINKHIAIVIVSHDPSQISTYIKDIACVEDGRLHYHKNEDAIQEAEVLTGCEMELLGHGKTPHRCSTSILPHRVLKDHEE